MPSSAGYLISALAASIALFFALWWMFVSGGDEAPWIPAGLAASVVLLVALSAREVVMRRAWTRYLLEQGIRHSHRQSSSHSKRIHSTSLLSAALRTIQKQSAEADAPGAAFDLHLDVFQLCRDYATAAEEALQSSNLPAEKRMALRTGQERARTLQKHHLLTWARELSRSLTTEAQQRARISDKIEAANKAVQCLDSALNVYPNEPELNASKVALREFIASVKVAHWVEMAERSAFKGHYRRAIERYKDALFYLERETLNEDVRLAGTERIKREIESLQKQVSGARRQKRDLSNDQRSGSETA
jgi:tetratricopeptide (TPR) repeat protein